MGRDSRGRAQEAQWKLMCQGTKVRHTPEVAGKTRFDWVSEYMAVMQTIFIFPM
jgi:hypothetical protein